MCGARRREEWNRAAWFLFFLLLPNLLAMSQDVSTFSAGDQEPVHVRGKPHSSLTGGGEGGEQERQLSRLGSRPPCCERKCGGCAPCKAVQVRAAEGRLQQQCANYEPVGWNCKCGGAVFPSMATSAPPTTLPPFRTFVFVCSFACHP